MITIGRRSTKARKIGDRTFFAKVSDEITRVTRSALDGNFCRDRGRRLIVTFKDGDLLQFRPHGTRHQVSMSLFDIYAWALRSIANNRRMAELREIKEKKAQARAERRLRRPLK
jgi:hypothetical protein